MATIHCASGKFKTESFGGTHVFTCVPNIIKKVRLHGSAVVSGCDETVVLQLKSSHGEVIDEAKLTLKIGLCSSSGDSGCRISSLCCPSNSFIIIPVLTFRNEGTIRTGTLSGTISVGVSTQCVSPITWSTTQASGTTSITLPSFVATNPSPPMLQIAADLVIHF